jgi:hypothetical protein
VKWLSVIGTCSMVLCTPCEVARCNWDHGIAFSKPCEVARCDWDHGVAFPKPCEVDRFDWGYGRSISYTM